MSQKIEAIFDGSVFRPTAPLELRPNTVVELTLVVPEQTPRVDCSFLDTAENAKLDGPEDWSENLDEYLYHGRRVDDE